MFKAYHFIRDAQNNVVDVEELEVTVTPLGLVIMVYSFSPFAIVAMPGTAEVTTNKTMIITSSYGGSAYVEENGKKSTLVTVKENESKKLTIKANDGYVVESVKIDGKVMVAHSSELTLNVPYSDLSASSFIEVNFVAKSVKDAEIARGESIVGEQLQYVDNGNGGSGGFDSSVLILVGIGVVIAAVAVVLVVVIVKRRRANSYDD